MDMHYVRWDGWQAVRPLSANVFEIQHAGPKGLESAALKLLQIPADPNAVPQLLAQGREPESVRQQLHDRMESAAAAYRLQAAMASHPNVLACEEPRSELLEDGFGWQLAVKSDMELPFHELHCMGMPEPQVPFFAVDIATALELCHQQGLIHEAVKASNIFHSGRYCQLGDFGEAKASGMPCGGDLSCMSPEVYWGMAYDHRTDIYALGILLYTCLNGGCLPFCTPGMTDEEVQNANVRRLSGEQIPAPPHGKPELQQLVLRACAYEPANRFSSAMEMRAAFLQLQGKDPATPLWPAQAVQQPVQMPQAPTYRPAAPAAEIPVAEVAQPAPKKNNSTLYLLLAVAAAVLVLGVVGFFSIHIWPEVSCNEVAKCKICGMTASTVQEHQWQSATCTKPETCSLCGEHKGEALGHQWLPATRDTAATCSVCGATEGTVLPPSLWVMQVVSTGWQGGHKQIQEGSTVLLSFPQDPDFVGSGLLVSDVYGKTVTDGFAVAWEKETARLTPAQTLAPGVYQLQFSNADAGAMVTVCYGYEEDFYLSMPEHFWSGDIWKSHAHGLYLCVTEQGVSAVEKPSRATAFESAMDMVGVENPAGGKLVPTATEPVALKTMRFIRGGEDGYTVFAYEGRYLACDGQGAVYFSDTLDENCYWVAGR